MRLLLALLLCLLPVQSWAGQTQLQTDSFNGVNTNTLPVSITVTGMEGR